MANKRITQKQLEKVGFERQEHLDFTDDGTRFKGYSYKELPMTMTCYQGTYYISLRLDYIKELTYPIYHNFKNYDLADEFNGSNNVSLEKLALNAELLLKDINEFFAQPASEQEFIKKVHSMKHEELINELLYCARGRYEADKVEFIKKEIMSRMRY